MTRSPFPGNTPFPSACSQERTSLGAAANVAANLAALGLKRVGFLTVIGDDYGAGRWRSSWISKDRLFLGHSRGNYSAYCKPIRYGYGTSGMKIVWILRTPIPLLLSQRGM